MRATRRPRRQHWLIVLLTAGTSAVAGAEMAGPLGALAGVGVMAVAW